MTDLTAIEERLALALTRIRDAAKEHAATADQHAVEAELVEAQARADTLTEELSDLKTLRSREADELDVLIGQLAPYLEETQNA